MTPTSTVTAVVATPTPTTTTTVTVTTTSTVTVTTTTTTDTPPTTNTATDACGCKVGAVGVLGNGSAAVSEEVAVVARVLLLSPRGLKFWKICRSGWLKEGL